MKKQETIEDIARWLRSKPVVFGFGETAKLADRLEAAWKREETQHGNTAAMREALKNLVDVIDRCASSSPLWWHNGAKGVIPLKNAKAALSAPPRNCDVGTTAEQSIRFDEFCQECEECPLNEKRLNIRLVQCEFLWAQMPYEKGGAK